MNKVENRIMLKIKTGYYLELVTRETMILLGSTKSKIAKDEKIAEVVLIHCNVVDNSYLQNSRILQTFVPNKSFGQLLDISLENLYF